MNYQYIYWDKENTNWDQIYKKYKPLFDNLKNNDKDYLIAATYFEEMVTNLMDNHFQVIFNQGLLSNFTINPAIKRKSKANNFHERYNYVKVSKFYLKDYITGNANISENGILLNATAGMIKDNILYFHCNFFALEQAYNSSSENKVKQVLAYFFSQLNNNIKPIKGVILDLRGNQGGNISDLNFFAGKLISRDCVFGYTRSKSGLGKFSYLPWIQAKLRQDQAYNTNASIMLLADNYTASLAEIMIISLKSKKNKCIGEQTYGATGVISDPDVFNSGSFSIGNFLTVKTSAVEFKGIDGQFYENIGIKPDISSPSNLKELDNGKDAQLELAITQFK
jgi:C-terminal processing protease CtpA/Prc